MRDITRWALRFLLALSLVSTGAWATEVARAVMLSGGATLQAPDGTKRRLDAETRLHVGDSLLTDSRGTLRLRFTDASEITLRPDTRFVIEKYHFDAAEPERDSLILELVKGGLRAVSGVIGKRADPDAYTIRTPSGQIGIRGTDYALMLCGVGGSGCSDMNVSADLASDGVPPDGLYVYVFEGIVRAVNDSGAKEWHAGRAGYVRDRRTAPRVLQDDPGLQRKFRRLRDAQDDAASEHDIDADKLRRLKRYLKNRSKNE